MNAADLLIGLMFALAGYLTMKLIGELMTRSAVPKARMKENKSKNTSCDYHMKALKIIQAETNKEAELQLELEERIADLKKSALPLGTYAEEIDPEALPKEIRNLPPPSSVGYVDGRNERKLIRRKKAVN